LIATILTSAADSLNPFAISQQFVLQGLVKKPRQIWYFIIPTGVTNLLGGFLAYFGLTAFIGDFFTALLERYGQLLLTAELILGIALLVFAGLLRQSYQIAVLKRQIGQEEQLSPEDKALRRIKSLSPLALIALGISATLAELTTALPYFAFLAILFNYQLAFWQLTGILLLYNLIYTSPLMIMYFIYIKAQDKFDRLYLMIKKQVTRWANILAPLLVAVIGIILIYHSVSRLSG
jgi:cytochrome c biogenesis protein CcdA